MYLFVCFMTTCIHDDWLKTLKTYLTYFDFISVATHVHDSSVLLKLLWYQAPKHGCEAPELLGSPFWNHLIILCKIGASSAIVLVAMGHSEPYLHSISTHRAHSHIKESCWFQLWSPQSKSLCLPIPISAVARPWPFYKSPLAHIAAWCWPASAECNHCRRLGSIMQSASGAIFYWCLLGPFHSLDQLCAGSLPCSSSAAADLASCSTAAALWLVLTYTCVAVWCMWILEMWIGGQLA